MREDNVNVYASHFSLAIYQIENLRNTHNERFILFAFVEELVHHYWRIENETEVKYKILEIVQLIDTGITLEMVNGWECQWIIIINAFIVQIQKLNRIF